MEKKKENIKTLIRWIVVGLLLLFVYITKQDLIDDALFEIKNIPHVITLICFLLTMMYYVTDGYITCIVSERDDFRLRLSDGFSCSLYCAFYKVTTLGAGSGISEIYYLSKRGIHASSGTGITLVQYAYQRFAYLIWGLFGAIYLYLKKYEVVMTYKYFIIGGLVISILVMGGIFLISYSEKIASMVIKLIKALLKRFPQKADSLCSKIIDFNNTGRSIWKNTHRALYIIFLNLIKMFLWYSIPAVVFAPKYNVDLLSCVCMMAVINMIAGIMISPAGIGTLEYVFTLFYGKMYGVTATTAVILYRFFTLIVPMLIGVIPVLRHNKQDDLPEHKEA